MIPLDCHSTSRIPPSTPLPSSSSSRKKQPLSFWFFLVLILCCCNSSLSSPIHPIPATRRHHRRRHTTTATNRRLLLQQLRRRNHSKNKDNNSSFNLIAAATTTKKANTTTRTKTKTKANKKKMASSLFRKRSAVEGATAGFVGTESSYAAAASTAKEKEEHDKTTSTATTTTTTTIRPRSNTIVVPKRDPVYLWSSLIAGVGSGALSSVICAPLDLIRTRLQVRGDLNMPSATLRQAVVEIMEKEGWKGYFRGLGASLATVPAFWGVYFPLYDELKRRWMIAQPDTQPSLIHCGSAVLAGAVSDLICNPLFVVRTRLQTEALHNLVDGAAAAQQQRPKATGMIRTTKALYKEGGIPIFWRGMTANLMGLSHVAVQFPVYEWLKTSLVKQRQHKQQQQHTTTAVSVEPNAMELFLASGLSKMTASLLTYPHEVIRSRMMDARGAAGTTLWYTAGRVYAQDGILGFYSGLPVALIRVIPNCCITFMTYELLLRLAKDEIKKRRIAGEE